MIKEDLWKVKDLGWAIYWRDRGWKYLKIA
jgi:hypothetical protein